MHVLDLARFVSKVEFTDTCWIWKGYTDRDGYGNFWLNGKNHQAHRVSFAWFVQPPSRELTLDHVKELCGRSDCVNPDHLEEVTRKENTYRRDGVSSATCKQGHPRAKYTQIYGGVMKCKACAIVRQRVYERLGSSKNAFELALPWEKIV